MKKKVLIIFVLMAIMVLPWEKAFATFSLSVTPYEGGYDLRYGKVSMSEAAINKKEVTISISSNIAKQYRVVQTLLQPLANIQGLSIPENNFIVYGIRGTNKYGTLAVEEERPVGLNRTFIYTSNQSGASDSFILVYSFKDLSGLPAGSYRGRIGFTLEPIDSTQSSVTTILNVFAEIEAESTVEIKTVSGTKIISLNSRIDDKRSAEVLVDIKGIMGNQFKIIQVMNEAPLSPEGYRLSDKALELSIREASKGTGIINPVNLSLGQQTIYTSGLRGDPETFIITYSLKDLSAEKAGKYRTVLKYLLDSRGYFNQSLIDSLTLEIENERVFELIVAPEMGGLLQFRDLKPQQPPRINEVIFEINTNMAKPYQVSQNAPFLFTNKEGEAIPNRYFTLRTERLDNTKGNLKYPQKTEIKLGDTVLFLSDKIGSSDTFKVIYELGIPPDLHAGDYSTRLSYSLSEI